MVTHDEEQMRRVQHIDNEQHNNSHIQDNIDDNRYMEGHEIVNDYDQKNEGVDKRAEGELTVGCEVDDTPNDGDV